jgi:hypothetical protein
LLLLLLLLPEVLFAFCGMGLSIAPCHPGLHRLLLMPLPSQRQFRK